MRKNRLALIATLAAVLPILGAFATDSSASAAHAAASSPAHSDATAALSAAKTVVGKAAISGLLNSKRVAFAFASSAGTCPPGTSDASYCLGGSGNLTFSVVLSTAGQSTVDAVSDKTHFAANSTISVNGKISRAGLALLRYAKSHKATAKVSFSSEAVISSSSYSTATGSLKIK
jgi:hypothetical protein